MQAWLVSLFFDFNCPCFNVTMECFQLFCLNTVSCSVSLCYLIFFYSDIFWPSHLCLVLMLHYFTCTPIRHDLFAFKTCSCLTYYHAFNLGRSCLVNVFTIAEFSDPLFIFVCWPRWLFPNICLNFDLSMAGKYAHTSSKKAGDFLYFPSDESFLHTCYMQHPF